jgi:hypothetical protein
MFLTFHHDFLQIHVQFLENVLVLFLIFLYSVVLSYLSAVFCSLLYIHQLIIVPITDPMIVAAVLVRFTLLEQSM